MLNKLFRKYTLKLRVVRALLFDKKSFLYSTGWMVSYKYRKPMDLNGNPIPWINYSFVKFITPRLKKHFKVFEFGSGFSTLYFSNYVDNIYSIEYDETWYNLLKINLPSNVTLIFSKNDTNGKYCRSAIESNEKYDIIIVDGRDRINCLRQSIEALNSTGVLILDDSDEPKYFQAFEILRREGFKEITIQGLKPISNKIVSSTIFYRNSNIFDI